MNVSLGKYASLAPLDVDLETKIANLARGFFSPFNYQKNCGIIGQSPVEGGPLPLSMSDFLTYLVKQDVLEEPTDKYLYHILRLLGRMATSNILVEINSVHGNVMTPKSYCASVGITNRQSGGLLWLARSLGGRFIHRQVAPAIVHITGKTKAGKEASGSGIVFDPHHILTCRHVVCDMEVCKEQNFQGKNVTIGKQSILKHNKFDVAVIRVDDSLRSVPGLAFLSPDILQTVYTFGYPKIPGVRPKTPQSVDSYLIVQRGEVTNDAVIASDGSQLFLYSAISRPGNSGGAIVSDDGYVVGISTDLTEGRYEGEGLVAPHHVGIPSDVIDKAVAEMGLSIRLPYELYE